MPIDDLTALGQKMREARKNKELTQQELSDLSHVSVKQIANIEKGKMNPSYLILRALAKVLHISLDTLINPDVSLEDEGVNQMKMLYSSCPPEMRDTLLHHTQETVKELTELSEKFETENCKSTWHCESAKRRTSTMQSDMVIIFFIVNTSKYCFFVLCDFPINGKLIDTIIKSLQHDRQLFWSFYVCFMTCFHKFMEVGIVQIMAKFF